MWRASILCGIAALAFAELAGAVVVCGTYVFDQHFVSSASCTAPCVARITQDFFPYTGPILDASVSVSVTRDAVVALGTACAPGVTAVVMSPGDYQVLIDGAGVVTKLQEGFDMGVIALVIVALLVGFWFGWKAVQRGTSQ